MPIHHQVLPRQRLVEVILQHEVLPAELFDYKRRVWADPELAGYNELVDLRPMTNLSSISTADLRQLASFAASMDPRTGSARMAILTSNSHQFGLARMYEAYRELHPENKREVEVFLDRHAALQWLGALVG